MFHAVLFQFELFKFTRFLLLERNKMSDMELNA